MDYSFMESTLMGEEPKLEGKQPAEPVKNQRPPVEPVNNQPAQVNNQPAQVNNQPAQVEAYSPAEPVSDPYGFMASVVEPETADEESLLETAGSYVAEPLSQIGAGLVSAGRTTIETLENIPRPLDVIASPKEYAYGGLSNLVNSISLVAENITNFGRKQLGVEGKDIKWGRMEAPDTDKKVNPYQVALDREQAKTDRWLKQWDKDYEAKHGSPPAAKFLVGLAPDFLVGGLAAVENSALMAGFTSYLLAGGRADAEGLEASEKDDLQTSSALFGAAGAKVAQALMNKLSKKEVELMEDIALNPKHEEDHKALLRFFYDSKRKYNSELLRGDKTGNPYIDKMVSKLKEDLGTDNYRNYMKAMNSVAGKAELSMKELARQFQDAAGTTYKTMKESADQAWDDVARALPTNVDGAPVTVSTETLGRTVDTALEGYPPEVINFGRRVLNQSKYTNQLKHVDQQIKILKGDREAELMAAASDEAADDIRDLYAEKIGAALADKRVIEGIDAQEALNVNAKDLVDMIKKLNHKAFIKGSNINTSDATNIKGLMKIRETLEAELERFPNAEAYKDKIQEAKSYSQDIFKLFGASKTGKNKGHKVFTPELGTVIDRQFPQAVKVVDALINEKPTVFLSKLNHIKDYVDDTTFTNLKKYHIESKLRGVTELGAKGKAPRVVASKFESAMGELLDSTDGRELLKNAYGTEMLDTFSFIRLINKEILDKAKPVDQSSLKRLTSYVTGLPAIVKTLVTKDIANYRYLARHLKAYGDDIGFKTADIAAEIIGRGAGGAEAQNELLNLVASDKAEEQP